jgi:cell division protein FtsB
MCVRVSTSESKPDAKRRIARGKQPGWTRRLVHWLLVFVAAAIIVDGLVGERGLLAMLRARHDYDELSAAIARQRAENVQLREQIRRLTDDPQAIEEIARRELGLIRPGERVFIIKDILPAKQ